MVDFDDEIHRLFVELRDLGAAERTQRLAVLEGDDPERFARLVRIFANADRATDELSRLMVDVDERRPPPHEIAGYAILGPLDSGGQGRVFRARQAGTERVVAIKLFDPTRVPPAGERFERFNREARIMGRLDHPNIAHVYSAGVAAIEGWHWPYIAMELVDDGVDVIEHARRANLSITGRVELIIRICEVVAFAHAAGVIHRDLKPANILVDRFGQVRVIDFGVASLEGDAAGRTRLTHTDRVLGTPMYMSPEQAKSGRAVDDRSDVYSLGAIAYELVCGEVPVRASPLENREFDVLIEWTDPVAPRKRNPRIPLFVSHVIETALRKNPADRYESALLFAKNLRDALAGERPDARPLSRTFRLLRWIWTHKAVSSATLLVAVAGAVAIQSVAARVVALRNESVALVERELAVARGFMDHGNWVEAERTLENLSRLDSTDPVVVELMRIDILEGQSRIPEERARIDALEARLAEQSPVNQARILLLAGDHSREPQYKITSGVDRAKVERALELGGLGGGAMEYASALLAESPVDQERHLRRAIEIEPGHHRAHEMLAPTLLFSGRTRAARAAAQIFRARFPDDPCAEFIDLATRCLAEEVNLETIRPDYALVPEPSIADLRALLEVRSALAELIRKLASLAIENSYHGRPYRTVQTLDLFNQFVNQIAPRVAGPTQSTSEPLYRLAPGLASRWRRILTVDAMPIAMGMANSATVSRMESEVSAIRDGALPFLLGLRLTNRGDFKQASELFSHAAECESFLDLRVATDVFALQSAATANDRSFPDRLARSIGRLLAREDLNAFEFDFLCRFANGSGQRFLTREIAYRFARTLPLDAMSHARLAWIHEAEYNDSFARRYAEEALVIDAKNPVAQQVIETLNKRLPK